MIRGKTTMTSEHKRTLCRIASAVVLTVAALFLRIEGMPRLAAFCVPYLIAGYDVLWGALRNIIRGQVFDERFLMTVATVGAFAVGEYPEAAGVMIFYQIGELFQSIAVGRSRRSIAELMDIRPDHAVVLRGDEEITVSPDEVSAGETIIVRPGERVPLDGEIISGATAVDSSALTGESLPVEKNTGDMIYSGSVNLTGLIRVRTTGEYGESTVAGILELVSDASDRKSRTESFITRFARWYTPCVVTGAVLLALIPPLAFSQPWGDWIRRALIFLMVSCPCALVVSVPLTFFGGIGCASRRGILVKGAEYIEPLAKTDPVVFDKTGTLTKVVFKVNAVHPNEISADSLLDIAAAAESHSNHPVGASIVAAHGGHIDNSRIGFIREISGKGIEAEIDGEVYTVGNGTLMDDSGAEWHQCHLTGTVIHVARGSRYLGHIVISDAVKPDSAQAVAELRKLGITRTVMLTGDGEKAAQAAAAETGVDEYRSQLLPAGKVSAVEELISEGRKTAFVGDGINDAPVLARADVGIAMGALGSDAAIESADVVLMDDSPSKLPAAIRIARRTMSIVKQNIVFSLVVKAAILLLAALGKTDMWVAVFGDVGVMIITVLNSARAMLKTR